MPVLDVNVTNNGVTGYWVAVDDSDISLTNGKGKTKDLTAGVHTLVWWMVGNPGKSIGIELKNGDTSVVKVASSTIPSNPPGNTHGAGIKKFTV